ncbi:MAG: carbohydrate-binding family 9-like protein [Calditrichaeota bacterium]|nr:carbohydrate-binding family 9-like protein [Calditrichota bacterium]
MNKARFFYYLLFPLIAVFGNCAVGQDSFPRPKIPFNPKHYICYRTSEVLTIDGKLDEPAWKNAQWTDYFVDIEGSLKPLPRFKTRVKMLWDDRYFYFAAEMEEPHVWGVLTKRDTVIFYDNDFEIFIDPDGDTHEYYEFEMNALNTFWDLLLTKPYRDGNCAVNAWDIKGIKRAVWVNGTLNDPSDRDKGWQAEVAIPWEVLKECAHRPAPPKAGDQWRVNFSRVEWQIEIKNGKYRKKIDPRTGKPFPEDNWVWSPQGLIAMHYPEMWGFVQFSEKIAGRGKDSFRRNPDEDVKWALFQLYYAQKDYRRKYGHFAKSAKELGLKRFDLKNFVLPPKIETTSSFFEATIFSDDGSRAWSIRQDGKVWQKRFKK